MPGAADDVLVPNALQTAKRPPPFSERKWWWGRQMTAAGALRHEDWQGRRGHLGRGVLQPLPAAGGGALGGGRSRAPRPGSAPSAAQFC